MQLVHIELTQYEIGRQGQFKIIMSKGIDHLLWLLAIFKKKILQDLAIISYKLIF
jgi:hypothetical protein